MSAPRKDIICERCANVRLINEIVRVFEQHSRATDLREYLAPIIEEAKRQGFGADEQEIDK